MLKPRFWVLLLLSIGIAVSSPPAFPEENVSVSMNEVAAGEILKMVCQKSGRNIIVSGRGSVAKISVEYKDMSVDSVLADVAGKAGLQLSQSDGVWIFTDQPPVKVADICGTPFQGSSTISLDFRNTDVREILKLCAQKGDINILVSKTVRGDMTIRLMDLPILSAIRAIAGSKGCGVRECANILIVGESKALETFSPLPAAEAKAGGETLSLDFRDTDIRQVLMLAARKGGQGYFIARCVMGNVSVRVTDVPPLEFLNAFSFCNGYGAFLHERMWVFDSPKNLESLRERLLEPLPVKGNPVSMEFRDIGARDVAMLLGRKSPVPVHVPEKLKGKLTLGFNDLDSVFALRLLAVSCGYKCSVGRNLIQIKSEGDEPFITVEPDQCKSSQTPDQGQ